MLERHPEGMTTEELTNGLLTEMDHTDLIGDQKMRLMVMNRFTAMKEASKKHGTPLPYRGDDIPYVNKDGKQSATMIRKLWFAT